MIALLCDLDMTLIDSRRDIAVAMVHALATKAGTSVTEAEVVPWIGRPLREMVARLAPAAGPERVEAAVTEYKAYFFERCDVHTRVYPGVRETLAALRARGVRLAVATTKMTFMARRVCAALGLDAYVDAVQGTDDFPAKPDPEVLRRACAALGVEPAAAWAVGDTVYDVGAARAAGCRVAAVTYGIGTRAELAAAGPDAMIDEFAEVADVMGSGTTGARR